MKSNKALSIVTIIILSSLVVGLIVLMVIGIKTSSGFNFNFNITKESDSLQVEKRFAAEDFQNIIADYDVANLYISESDSEAVVKIYAESNNYTVGTDNSQLKISEQKQNCGFFCVAKSKPRIEIQLPEGYKNLITITGDTGNIEISEMPEADIDLTLDAGNISVKSTKNIKIDSDTGDTKISNCLGRLDIKVDAGNISIDELKLKDNSYIELDTGNISIQKVGDVRVEVEHDVGNTDISGGNNQSTVSLKIKSDVGNISVK